MPILLTSGVAQRWLQPKKDVFSILRGFVNRLVHIIADATLIVIAVRPRSCASGSMRALRVLVVEDDALIATLLSELLAGMGHDVCATAATEARAVAAAARDRPDLIIVDAALARGSGISAVEEILRAGPVAHLFVSGDPGTVQALRPSAVVVRKPFREADLVRAITTALNAATTG